eukprot:TRINITY_DN1454_c0_g2_i1.p1 TRINITY_DN1454_c0_g2~~TRINITY_DN1454_c0_g2_i1.p1  ORF type:complete len:935 (+),score=290.04 TRINITY_DN1454_c0_g2_i1:285-3089(+)
MHSAGLADSGNYGSSSSNNGSPRAVSYRHASSEQLAEMIFQLQQQLIERDATIHRLNTESILAQQDDTKKQEIKRGFLAVERRNVDTTSINTVLRDSTNHMLYTLTEVYGCKGGVLLLDVPYNQSVGSTNTDILNHILLRSYWVNGGVSGHSLVDAPEDADEMSKLLHSPHGSPYNTEQRSNLKGRGVRRSGSPSTPTTAFPNAVPAFPTPQDEEGRRAAVLQRKLSDLHLYRDVIVQKKGRVYTHEDVLRIQRFARVDDNLCEPLKSLMVCPIVVEATTIALVVLYNSKKTPAHRAAGDASSLYAAPPEGAFIDDRDPRILMEVLPELWTSGINPLLNVAIEADSHRKTEESLAHESEVRDEIILSLDTILDEVSQLAMKSTALNGQNTSRFLWKAILQRVANFFEDYFSSDCLIAVTNSQANFRLQKNGASSTGSRHTPAGRDLPRRFPSPERFPSAGGETRFPTPERLDQPESVRVCPSKDGHDTSPPYDVDGLHFLHYVFCDSLKLIKAKLKLNHPVLGHTFLMKEVICWGTPYYSDDSGGLSLPCGHMKITNMLLVPIIFCDEPVGLLGLANGDFSVSSGRILQSVFTTFWSMIVKATLMSESQKVLNAALPPQISERLKNRAPGKSDIADSYPTSTVFFADIVGFTSFTKELEPWEVVEFCNLIFAKLDALVRVHQLEMIQVIGDCYMCVGGIQDKSGNANGDEILTLPQRTKRSQLKEMIDFALSSIEESKHLNSVAESLACSPHIKEGLRKRPLHFRIGICEGPLTAGILGNVKMQYDVLGETVNFAARLEGTSQPDCIHVNSSIRDCLADDPDYRFEARKPISLKGLGLHQTYFLTPSPEKKESIASRALPVPIVERFDRSPVAGPENRSFGEVGTRASAPLPNAQLEKIRRHLMQRRRAPLAPVLKTPFTHGAERAPGAAQQQK